MCGHNFKRAPKNPPDRKVSWRKSFCYQAGEIMSTLPILNALNMEFQHEFKNYHNFLVVPVVPISIMALKKKLYRIIYTSSVKRTIVKFFFSLFFSYCEGEGRVMRLLVVTCIICLKLSLLIKRYHCLVPSWYCFA